MNICVPVTEDKGLDSPISAHFGSAPLFVVCDTDSGAVRALSNRNAAHEHGMCQPLLSLQGEQIDGIVVGGIGMGALSKLQASGIRVFLTGPGTVAEAVAVYRAGRCRGDSATAWGIMARVTAGRLRRARGLTDRLRPHRRETPTAPAGRSSAGGRSGGLVEEAAEGGPARCRSMNIRRRLTFHARASR